MLKGKIDSQFLGKMEGLACLSRNQVSKRAKFSTSFLYDLANGKGNPTLATINQLASVFLARFIELGYVGEDFTPGPVLQAMGVVRIEELWIKLLKVDVALPVQE